MPVNAAEAANCVPSWFNPPLPSGPSFDWRGAARALLSPPMTPHYLPSPSPRLPTALLLAASVAIIGVVLIAQFGGGLAPCELCLYERWPYYAAIVATLAGLLSGSPRGMRAILGLCAL